MPRKPLSYPKNREKAIAKWKAGARNRDLAIEYQTDSSAISRLVKGIPQTLGPLIDKQVEIKQELATLNQTEIDLFNQEVENRVHYLRFFNKASLELTTKAMEMVRSDARMNAADMRHVSEIIARQREGVLGKSPDTVINNINAQQSVTAVCNDPKAAMEAYLDMLK